MANSRRNIEDLLRTLPGIGSRHAERLTTALLEKGPVFCKELGTALESLHTKVRQCKESFQYFESSDPHEMLSPIARDSSRDSSLLMVVEKDTDIEYIEKSDSFRGKYLVLGGLVPMLKSKTKDSIRIQELIAYVTKHKSVLQEIILAFAFTPEGDHTRLYVETKLHEIVSDENHHITISVLGRGLAFGSEIEYSDPATISYALEHRIKME